MFQSSHYVNLVGFVFCIGLFKYIYPFFMLIQKNKESITIINKKIDTLNAKLINLESIVTKLTLLENKIKQIEITSDIATNRLENLEDKIDDENESIKDAFQKLEDKINDENESIKDAFQKLEDKIDQTQTACTNVDNKITEHLDKLDHDKSYKVYSYSNQYPNQYLNQYHQYQYKYN